MNQERYDKFLAAAKRLNLSNNDVAVLLQVTPVMVSRYKKNADGLGKRGDKGKLIRAAKALKVVRSSGVACVKQMSPGERIAACMAAVQQVDPDLVVKAPIVI